MLAHPTLDRLHQLGLFGMAQAFEEIMASDHAATLSFSECLGLMLDRETTYRCDRKLRARLRYARLRHQATVEDVDYRTTRGLDRALFQKLVECSWIDAHDNLIVCGPTGVGKSFLACALGHKACRDNRSVLYQRAPKLFADLALARGDGRYARICRALFGVQLLVIDDFALEPLDAQARHELLEIVEERYGRRSTLITSQLPVDQWHKIIADPTYADAILDRLVHNAHRIYAEAPDAKRPVVCFDESPTQLIGEVRQPIPAAPGQRERYDCEYKRNGTVNLFVFLDAHRAWRRVKVTEQRTARDFAQCMRELVDLHYPQAEQIRVVLDNLSTHSPGALYEAFPACEAHRVLRRLEFHYTPKHASWLNMVEIEIGVLRGQCLDRRIGERELLISEIAAWERRRNASRARIKWMFTTERARTKLARAYPHPAKES